jgi:DNA-binding SARP family transcriptional activator
MTIEAFEQLVVFIGWAALLALLALALARAARARSYQPNSTATPNANRRGRASVTLPRVARAAIDVAPTLTIRAPIAEDKPAQPAAEADDGDHPASPRTPGDGLRVVLLGPFSIDGPDGRLHTARSSTEQLIAYLALHPAGATRDDLTEALWPGEDPFRTRQRLWQSTSEARKLIGEALISKRGHYALDRTKLTLDADELDLLLAEAKTADDAETERRVLERGRRLLRGEPLAGWDQLWTDSHAARLRATQAELLERLARARLACGDPQGALEAAEHALRRDALNEPLWRLAMKAESALGLREALTRRYERLRALLDDQLGLQPEAETRTLYHQALGQR